MVYESTETNFNVATLVSVLTGSFSSESQSRQEDSQERLTSALLSGSFDGSFFFLVMRPSPQSMAWTYLSPLDCFSRDFSGGPVVMNLLSNAGDSGFNPWLWN